MQNVNLHEVRGSAFDLLKKQVYEDAMREAKHPTRIPDGQLREVRKLDESGRPIIEFCGKAGSWMQNFSTGTTKRLTGICTGNREGL